MLTYQEFDARREEFNVIDDAMYYEYKAAQEIYWMACKADRAEKTHASMLARYEAECAFNQVSRKHRKLRDASEFKGYF